MHNHNITMTKNMLYSIIDFSGKAKTLEYLIFFIIDIASTLLFLKLFYEIDLDNQVTLKNVFYCCLIEVFTFVPIQAALTRRLRNLGFPTWLIIINYIPILKYLFKLSLIFNYKKSCAQ
ncbi:DUF805 domain-containing protein [Flavobacterium luminosum]|uniref:DUF805 domain-containing protein n=1 Tax=Flavobacterium luminosum TaxID=2949086 RepID=UPI0038CC1279